MVIAMFESPVKDPKGRECRVKARKLEDGSIQVYTELVIILGPADSVSQWMVKVYEVANLLADYSFDTTAPGEFTIKGWRSPEGWEVPAVESRFLALGV